MDDEYKQFDVRVWNTGIEATVLFVVLARTAQRAKLAVRDMFPADILTKRVLRVWAGAPAEAPTQGTASWEPL